LDWLEQRSQAQAGLAQTTKNESNITGQNAQVKVENTHPTSNEKAAG
jgi:hypothetical protein